jgi:hypothetical protein
VAAVQRAATPGRGRSCSTASCGAP